MSNLHKIGDIFIDTETNTVIDYSSGFGLVFDFEDWTASSNKYKTKYALRFDTSDHRVKWWNKGKWSDFTTDHMIEAVCYLINTHTEKLIIGEK